MVDYRIKSKFFVQLAPQYSWLWKWNEHYLTLPIHLKKFFGARLSIFTGPALTFDVGYFKSLGVSAGVDYQFSNHCAVFISVFSFDLFDYSIDYLYVPVSVALRFFI